ncbi:MAG: hypothetical protein D3910_20315, partial [Candidatus Electrothrix sp. ATG2]|nr:hypothetical protein [Candidatus Electrothrix sp. ATG2]
MTGESTVNIAYAGDRQLSVDILNFLHQNDISVSALVVSKGKKASHAEELISLCDYLPSDLILEGKKFREKQGIALLSALDLDYIIGIHFPYIVPKNVLTLPKYGVINLHPAFLPFNRGWHTASWAIIDGTPYGATLHLMDEGVDTGDILHQKEVKVCIDDTAHTLYQKVLKAEYEVFIEYWPNIATRKIHRKKQKLKNKPNTP